MDIENNIKRYLDTETILNKFFNVFDYCVKQCIPLEMKKNRSQIVSACCKDKYYIISDLDHPAYDRLRNEREKRYGPPEKQVSSSLVSPCEYHTSRGCCLLTHKSPICLAFMCRKSIDFLRATYGIYTYDYLGMYYALEWILTGDLSDENYEEFRKSIILMTLQVKEKK